MQERSDTASRDDSRRLETAICTGMKPSKTARKMRVPTIGRHSSGQARVTLGGKVYYLGPYGSVEAMTRFGELLKEWQSSDGKPRVRTPHAGQVATVATVFDAYRAWIDSTGRYTKNGQPTSQRPIIERALNSCASVIGSRRIADVGEGSLMAWRDELERNQRLTRGGINRLVTVVLGVLRWAKAREHMPAAAYASCASIVPLKRKECGGRAERGRKRRAVSLEDIEKVAAVAHPHAAAMLRVQALTGMRPGEAIAMRWHDIDKAPLIVDGVSLWVYRVANGKTAHHGRDISYPLSPKVQAILEGMPPVLATARIFVRNRRGEEWDRDRYRDEVVAACGRASVPMFSPHEVRHGAITRAAETHGILAAQALANHARATTTARYLHTDDGAAHRVAASIG